MDQIKARRRRRARRASLGTLFVLLGVAVVWLSLVPALLRIGLLRGTIEERVSAMAGRPVQLGSVDLPDARTFEATRVEVAGLSIDRLRVRFDDIAPLGEIVEVEADGVRARVEVTEQFIRDLLTPRPTKEQALDVSLPPRLPRIVVRGVSLDGSFADEPMAIRDGEARLDPDGAFAITGRLVTSPDPAIDVRGTLDGPRVRFDRIKFATLSATGDLRPESARLEVETVAIPKALAKLVEKFTGVRAAGRLAGRLALAGPRIEGRLRFDDVAVAAGDFEGTRVAGTVDFDIARTGSTWDGTAHVILTRAELLRGELYTEIEPAGAVMLSVEGSFDPPGRLDVKTGHLTLGPAGGFDFSGQAMRIEGGLAYDVTLEADFAAKALAERIASILSLDLAMDGSLGVDATLSGRGRDYVLSARARFAKMSVRLGQVAVTALDGELPLILGGAAREAHGELRFDEFSPARGVTFGKQQLAVIAGVDELRVPEPVWFAPWGGQALVVDAAIAGLRGQPSATCTLETRNIDLASVLAAFGSTRRIEGKASLERGRVLASRAQVTLTAGVSLEVFEGAAQLTNIRVVQPLDGTHRAIGASLNAQGIRLKSVCETLTEFGLIDGVVDVSGAFELHHTGLPNWMQLLVRSTPRKGVTQQCDLRAVHALARLMGQPAVAEQLDRLPANRLEYDRLGFYAAMDVDFTFYLRGLWFKPDRTGEFVDNGLDDLKRGKRPSEPGLEYLMIGSGINMNIANPGGAIDFNDMLERFRNVSR